MERLAKSYSLPMTDAQGRDIDSRRFFLDDNGHLTKDGVPFARITVTVITASYPTRKQWRSLVDYLGLRVEPIGPFGKDEHGRFPHTHSWSVWGERESLEALVASSIVTAWNASEAKTPFRCFGSGSNDQRKAALKRAASDKRSKAEESLARRFSEPYGQSAVETGTLVNGKQSVRKAGESYPNNPDNPADSPTRVLADIAKVAKLG